MLLEWINSRVVFFEWKTFSTSLTGKFLVQSDSVIVLDKTVLLQIETIFHLSYFLLNVLILVRKEILMLLLSFYSSFCVHVSITKKSESKLKFTGLDIRKFVSNKEFVGVMNNLEILDIIQRISKSLVKKKGIKIRGAYDKFPDFFRMGI